jgi:hypothetical protein
MAWIWLNFSVLCANFREQFLFPHEINNILKWHINLADILKDLWRVQTVYRVKKAEFSL